MIRDTQTQLLTLTRIEGLVDLLDGVLLDAQAGWREVGSAATRARVITRLVGQAIALGLRSESDVSAYVMDCVKKGMGGDHG